MLRPPLSLKGRALRLLSQREHSRTELERKLARHVQDGDQLAAILDDLESKDFINASRVVDSVVNRRAGVMGAARIRQELHAKGLKGELVQQALAGLQPSEFERAQEVWQRKFSAPSNDSKVRARQMRFLMARGFSGEVSCRVLRSASANQ